MAVKLYKDAGCTTEVTNYDNLFSNAKLSPFTKTPINDSIKLYAKKEGSETQEHFALRADYNSTSTFLEASVGTQKSVLATFTRVSDKVYTCKEANKFSVGDFLTSNGNDVVQITAISGNEISFNLDFYIATASAAKLLPLGDTTNAVEITINRNIPYEEVVSISSTWFSYNLNTFWEE